MGEIYSYVTCIEMFKPIRANIFIYSRNVYTRNKDLNQPVYQGPEKCQRTKKFLVQRSGTACVMKSETYKLSANSKSTVRFVCLVSYRLNTSFIT